MFDCVHVVICFDGHACMGVIITGSLKCLTDGLILSLCNLFRASSALGRFRPRSLRSPSSPAPRSLRSLGAPVFGRSGALPFRRTAILALGRSARRLCPTLGWCLLGLTAQPLVVSDSSGLASLARSLHSVLSCGPLGWDPLPDRISSA